MSMYHQYFFIVFTKSGATSIRHWSGWSEPVMSMTVFYLGGELPHLKAGVFLMNRGLRR